jgi:hypothetical protein
MPKRPTKGAVGKYVEAPASLWGQMHALATSNGRTFRAELMHAMERHLAAPPHVETITHAEVPPLPGSERDFAPLPQEAERKRERRRSTQGETLPVPS